MGAPSCMLPQQCLHVIAFPDDRHIQFRHPKCQLLVTKICLFRRCFPAPAHCTLFRNDPNTFSPRAAWRGETDCIPDEESAGNHLMVLVLQTSRRGGKSWGVTRRRQGIDTQKSSNIDLETLNCWGGNLEIEVIQPSWTNFRKKCYTHPQRSTSSMCKYGTSGLVNSTSPKTNNSELKRIKERNLKTIYLIICVL